MYRMINWEDMRRNQQWPISIHHPFICLQWLWVTTKGRAGISRCPALDAN